MTIVSTAEFCNEIRAIYEAVASLKSCQANEIANEAFLLRRIVTRVCELKLTRRNETLLLRRAEAIKYSSKVLADRH
jgi:hypothetical protein